MSTLHTIGVALLGIDNPFKPSAVDAEEFGFLAICAGSIIAINVILVAVALASRRRIPRESRKSRRQSRDQEIFVPEDVWLPAAPPAVLVLGERENPLHAKRAQREAERLAAEGGANRPAPLRPARRSTAPPPRKH